MTSHDDDLAGFRGSYVGPPRPESPRARAQAIALERLPFHERARYLTDEGIGEKYRHYMEEALEAMIVEGGPTYPPLLNPAKITDEGRRLAIGAELERLRKEWQSVVVHWDMPLSEVWRVAKEAPGEIRWLLNLVEGKLPEDAPLEEGE